MAACDTGSLSSASIIHRIAALSYMDKVTFEVQGSRLEHCGCLTA